MRLFESDCPQQLMTEMRLQERKKRQEEVDYLIYQTIYKQTNKVNKPNKQINNQTEMRLQEKRKDTISLHFTLD